MRISQRASAEELMLPAGLAGPYIGRLASPSMRDAGDFGKAYGSVCCAAARLHAAIADEPSHAR